MGVATTESIQWGLKDYSLLLPVITQTVDDYDQQTYNLTWHLKQSDALKVMNWPPWFKKAMWMKHEKQTKLERTND
jgi:hypothetical protein